MQPEIIFEDSYLLIVSKPPGWVVPKPDFEKSIEGWAQNYLSLKYKKFNLGVPHRLDRLTSGIVILTKKISGFKSLASQFENRQIVKKYLAIVHGYPKPETAKLDHFIYKNEELKKAEIFTKKGMDRKAAHLKYSVLEKKEDLSLVDIDLYTGRYHQIRAQMNHIGHAVLGDKKYFEDSPFYPYHALHSYYIEFNHPLSGKRLRFKLSPPDRSFWKLFEESITSKINEVKT